MMLPCRVCGVPTLNKTPKPKRCSDCTKAEALDYSRWYYSVHRDEMREYHRIYHINNRERILVQHATWRAAKRAAEHKKLAQSEPEMARNRFGFLKRHEYFREMPQG